MTTDTKWTIANAIEMNGNISLLPYDNGGRPLWSAPSGVTDSPVLTSAQKVIWARATIARLDSAIKGAMLAAKESRNYYNIAHANRNLGRIHNNRLADYRQERDHVRKFLCAQRERAKNG